VSLLSRFTFAIKAIHQLGLTQVGLFGVYKFGLVTGHYRRVTPKLDTRNSTLELSNIVPLFSLPSRDQLLEVLGDDGRKSLLAEAGEIVNGKFRMFGGEPVDIKLSFGQPLQHWTDYETGQASALDLQPFDFTQGKSSTFDIKQIWEPARFGWAFTLGRAYRVTGDDRYAESFWHYFGDFSEGNPPYLGPNWTSGQEVAIRLMAFTWANQVFADAPSSMNARKIALSQAIAYHALRIPPTLVYARSQNNNHLLTEAAGLYTASLALPDHPQAKKWRQTGQRWLAWCFENQIDDTGEYVQHSTNYQRLMLQTALWVSALQEKTAKARRPQSENENTSRPSRLRGEIFTMKALDNLSNAARWLADLTDPVSGQVANLGANDGAYIFPVTTCPLGDFRPVVQAAGRAFAQHDLVPPGAWDEMSLWFGLPACEPLPASDAYHALVEPRLPILRQRDAWGCLRAARINSRPSHADSLHLDLWWRGLNLAQDAGTYLYNADPPWDNRLASTFIHNTVSVDGREQMTRAGRFLYLDWQPANAGWGAGADLNRGEMELHASHRAYGFWHRRSVIATPEKWQILDHLFSPKNDDVQSHTFRLHWLLPDWEWKLENREQGVEISLKSPFGKIFLNIQAHLPLTTYHSSLSLVRAGEYLHGSGGPDPVRGWVSPTYGLKLPALSLAVEVKSPLPLTFTTEFIFPTDH
jgi:hypothetical protein